ncbi:MAG TPA: BlaI/MecI/CopY family transcriptional regulator [Verrucomicrobiae bacterium]|nr:BlaI/MecI/CopY family transcriptional regulator [Verrucomicrobiae bacterium]
MATNSGQKQQPPRISDAEWTVMKAVWQLNGGTAREIIDALRDTADWKPKTIHTLIARLTQKGALLAEKKGREYVFKPRVSERSCRLAASRSFLARVFDGEIAPFLACFLENRKLSRKQIDELKAILEDKS